MAEGKADGARQTAPTGCKHPQVRFSPCGDGSGKAVGFCPVCNKNVFVWLRDLGERRP
jgi:hypothetical protein